MLNYISLYPNKYEEEFNMDFIRGKQDKSIVDYIITDMMELAVIENIDMLSYEVIENQDEVDINNHLININYKKKDLDSIEIPKYKYILKGNYGEVKFKFRVHTNLNEKVIVKRILFPIEDIDGTFLNNGKTQRAIWQLVDKSTYSQRGKIASKSRMPIIIYKNSKRITQDINGDEFVLTSYSYASVVASRRRVGSKKKTKFINPLMIYIAKMGYRKTKQFFGMSGIVEIQRDYTEDDEASNYIFPLNDLVILADRYLFDKYEMIQSYVCMLVNLSSKDFPVTLSCLEDREYWTCRIGLIGSVKNKNLLSFKEKGITSIYMIERLLKKVTSDILLLPDIYKNNIYYFIYWMITNYDSIHEKNNMDMKNKRVRKNEVIVESSLGKKISENINKLIERKSKSRLNTMDTLLELFNFPSDIIVSNMRNLNDLIKGDDLSNDMNFISDLSYSSKGPESLGEDNSNIIAAKYRDLDPSMAGVIDLFNTSNSDCGTSGSFVPYVQTYHNNQFFSPEMEDYTARYNFEKALVEEEGMDRCVDVSSLDAYIEDITNKAEFAKDLKYEPIEIIEKEE